jgi:paraquat-inducible protein B
LNREPQAGEAPQGVRNAHDVREARARHSYDDRDAQDREGHEREAHDHEEHRAGDRTEAVVRRSLWPGWIWAIPIAALAILVWLGLRFFFSHGADVIVYFDKAPGVNPQNTRVTYRGVDVGGVTSVELTPDGQRVEIKLSLDHSMEKYLRSGTRFWMQGLSSGLSDLSSLTSLISGPTLQMEPGPGQPQHVFVGLEQAPAFSTPTAGTRFTLLSDARDSVQQGSGVYYLGLEVGKVTSVQFVPPHSFQIEVLIQSPYDRLVHRDSRFWDAGALQLSFTQGLKLQLLSPKALLLGAIAFTTPTVDASEPSSAPGAEFTLYASEASAQLAPVGPHVLYTVQLPGAVGQLQPGAPVKLRNFVVGEVRTVGFIFDRRTGALNTPVTIELDADRLRFENNTGQGSAGLALETSASYRTQELKDAVAQLVRGGLRARLDQAPPLVGPYYIALELVPNAQPARVDEASDPPAIPAAPEGGLGSLTQKLGDLPIQQIGANVRTITDRIRMLTTSAQTKQSLEHLKQTVANIDQIVQQAKPQVQPLIANLRRASEQLQGLAASAHQTLGGPDEQAGLYETLDELTRTARSVRSLADYLEQHPASLIRGKQP